MFSSLPGKTDLSCLSGILNGLLDRPVTSEMGSRVLGPGAEPCQRLRRRALPEAQAQPSTDSLPLGCLATCSPPLRPGGRPDDLLSVLPVQTL